MLHRDREFVVVGGGPIGLLSGLLLLKNGVETTIYEEDKYIGYPQHCTGIVSEDTLYTYPIDIHKLVLNKFYGVIMKIGNKEIMVYRASTPKAFMIDRVMLEKKLAEKIIDEGGKILTNYRFSYSELGSHYKSSLIIDAGGVKSLIRRGYNQVLPAIQVDLKLENGLFSRELTEIIVDKRINKDYFMWIVPYKDSVFRIGSASREQLKESIFTILKNEDIEGTVENILGGLIVTGGPIKRFVSKNVIYVGDAAGMVKVTTGGGLYYGGVGACLLIDAILEKSLNIYQKRWMNKFGREIKLQKLVREIFTKCTEGELLELFSILSKNEVFNLMLMVGNMDFHASSLLKLLMEKDLMKILMKLRIISSVLKKMIEDYI